MNERTCPHGISINTDRCYLCDEQMRDFERRHAAAFLWLERGPALLAAAKEALDRLEAITLMGMSEYGGDGSAGFYKMRAYDAITTASRGVRGLVAAIAACEEIDHE